MTTLTRTNFLKEMAHKTIILSIANNDSRLDKLNLNQIDANNDGALNSLTEMKALFRAIDYYDRNGTYHSIYLGTTSNPTTPGKLVAAIRELAEDTETHQAASLTLSSFLQEMESKTLNIALASNDSRLDEINLHQADGNNNGVISGADDFTQLFKAIDNFDRDGNYHSLNLGTDIEPTKPGSLIAAVRELATSGTGSGAVTPPPPHDPGVAANFQDNAIANAFGNSFSSEIKNGDEGNKVVAVQYALGRLGHLNYVCDGDFGNRTLSAVQSFQSVTSGLTVTGIVKADTLSALDTAVSKLDLRPPAIKSSLPPMTFLSDFDFHGLPQISVDIRNEDVSWDSPDVQLAYGEFVQDYWEVMKENRIEADCKALALFFMDQFRKKLAQDTFIELPLPRSPQGSFPDRDWMIATRTDPKGLFRRVAELFLRSRIRVNRPGYAALKKIQNLDPDHAMLYGVNVKYPRTSAHQVSRAATVVAPWRSSYSNRGDYTKAEIPLGELRPGYLIFIDHSGNGSYDHTVNIVKIKKDQDNNVRQIVMAVGSYDDVRDNLASTVVNSLGILNQYAEEVTVELDEYEKIISSEVTWSSEPSYVVKTRYSAKTTLMEARGGGKLKISRWG